ncbi:nitrous oxide reductase accessory protein NosL [Shewanella sp. NFH-SH190041]|uniref:nitrous oxide reductase accessory protein NosL n=1 Tax=Shewanella sp. NFH-SH190041 TaxID=2950245 RepID=UPI0021C34824|nr:nitrous oxide reductase accessory protein NosL [Shewanella sp. NFH-SH190041]BDM65597.1 nitrous oxide reductase accessory protein NosL [Shewanella sp. NFH-SH190041]
MKKLLPLMLLPFIWACGESSADEKSHAPVAIDAHDRCHICGMMITKYPGPKGELILKNTESVPKFCSSRDMFNFALQAENQRQIQAYYVHDAGKTDWAKPDDSAFIDAKTAYYVYAPQKKAVMGPAVAPFSSLEAAEKFAAEYGGRVMKFDDITLSLLSQKN